MGCNCKAQKKISYIQTKYGDMGRQTEKTGKKFTFGYALKIGALLCLVVALFPLILLAVILAGIFAPKNSINIGKLLHI